MKGQAPGWYRLMLADEWLTSPLDLSVNAFLVNTGTKLVMIDAGGGALYGPALGRVIENLRASGYGPEQVDEIYITHLHGDHVGGVMLDGKAAFPNAIVRGDRHDADYWLNLSNAAAAPESARPSFLGVQLSLKPYVESGRYRPFDGAAQLLPGIRAVPAYGHTPGHAVYVVESRGQKMLFSGDLMHIAPVQFPNPGVTISFDTDAAGAAAARAKLFADAAAQGHYLAAAHVSFPGIGRLKPAGAGYRWLPVPYSPNR